MFSSRDAYDNDFCPVRDELLGEMYRASESGLAKLVDSVSSDVRAMLALFCYRRSHLHSLALAIAASCSERESDPDRQPRRLDAVRALPRSAGGTHGGVLRRPQADHALHQAALCVVTSR